MLHTCMAREKKCEVVPLVGSEGTEGLEQEHICGVWLHHGGVTAVAQVGQQSQNLQKERKGNHCQFYWVTHRIKQQTNKHLNG